ncbi:MAG: GTP-binding protein [Isosphaeraceae bacterium]|nr:GTP-binding protein [Isosphaeraceae bacterium]
MSEMIDQATAPGSDDLPKLDDLLARLDPATTDPDTLVERARAGLDALIAGLKLEPSEALLVADEIRGLEEISAKLDASTVEIAAFGMVSRGKSSLLNALLGRDAFRSGATHGTTVKREAERWEASAPTPAGFEEAKLVLVDTPGIDEVGGEVRETLARDVARRADLILFVVSGDMTRREFEALAELREASKPIILVFNQVDRYPESDRDQILAKITNERVRQILRPEDVVPAAAKPDAYRVKIQAPDGTTSVVWERPAPLIEPLKQRILEVLETEGKALVALNTLLFAGDMHEAITARKFAIRDDAANRLIWHHAIAKGVAVAVNPVPVADLMGGLAVDVAMIVALGRVYGVPITKTAARGIVRESIKTLGTLGAVDVVSKLGIVGLKSLLGGATILSGGLAAPVTALGYAAAGVAVGGTAAATSYILGEAAKVYLRRGKDWGPDGINTVIREILDRADRDSVIARLEEELKRKIGIGK